MHNKKSRYVKGGTTDIYATRLGWWDRYVFSPSRTDVTYTIEQKYHLRPDLLSYTLYGSPVYTWVILQYNNILDINTEFVVGKVITLPTPIRVKTEMT
jgi:hypothetical protein